MQVCPVARDFPLWCVVRRVNGWWVCRKDGEALATKWLAGPYVTKVEALDVLRKLRSEAA